MSFKCVYKYSRGSQKKWFSLCFGYVSRLNFGPAVQAVPYLENKVHDVIMAALEENQKKSLTIYSAYRTLIQQ